MSGDDAEMVRAWLEAADRQGVAAALESIYAEVAGEVGRRAPVCRASGRCCRFDEYGHRLYVTGLEAAYTLVRAPVYRAQLETHGSRLTVLPACPLQVDRLCSVHESRPLGCRVFFCDGSPDRWQEELTERLLGRIRALHEEHSVPYRYAEWRSVLRLFVLYAGMGGRA